MRRTFIVGFLGLACLTACATPSTPLQNDEGRVYNCSAWGFGVIGTIAALSATQNCVDKMKAAGWHPAGETSASATPISAEPRTAVSGSNLAAAQPLQPSVYAQRTMPNMLCSGPDVRQWDNCVGTFTYPNGNVYRGEFHDGTRQGFGVININARGVSDEHNILSREQAEYIGEFRNDRLNGHGVWFTASGAIYSGTFVNNIPQSDLLQRNCSGPSISAWTNCVAAHTYPNGNIYRGEFVQGQRQGVGLIEIHATGTSDGNSIRTPVPGIYIGEFQGDRLNGHGVIMMPDSAFYGLFRDNILSRL